MKLDQLPNGDLVIPLDGYILDGCRVDLNGEFDFTCSKADTSISMSEFELHASEEVRTINAENRNDWPMAFNLLGLVIDKCQVSSSSGILTLGFRSGIELKVLPYERTEHWAVNIAGAPAYKVLSMPGEGFDWWCLGDSITSNPETLPPSK